MGKLEDKYRRSLSLLRKKLTSMISYNQKEIDQDIGSEYWQGYCAGRVNCLSDIRDDVMNILNNTREDTE